MRGRLEHRTEKTKSKKKETKVKMNSTGKKKGRELKIKKKMQQSWRGAHGKLLCVTSTDDTRCHALLTV